MSAPLSTYLHDHLAGSVLALELLDNLSRRHASEPVGRWARELREDIEADREVLRRLADAVGAGRSSPVKEAMAWVGGQASRLKLGRLAARSLGTFETLELLSLGILGKVKLWRALAELAPHDVRLQDLDLDGLMARAQNQHEQAEAYRLQAARALAGGEATG